MTIFLGGKIAKYCSQLLREATKLPFKTSEPQPLKPGIYGASSALKRHDSNTHTSKAQGKMVLGFL